MVNSPHKGGDGAVTAERKGGNRAAGWLGTACRLNYKTPFLGLSIGGRTVTIIIIYNNSYHN